MDFEKFTKEKEKEKNKMLFTGFIPRCEDNIIKDFIFHYGTIGD